MSQPLDGRQSRNCQTVVDGETSETQKAPPRGFSKSLSLISLPNDVQRSFSHLPTPEERRFSLRGKISEIGRENPTKASEISRKLLFYRGTAGEREELESLGIQVPDMRIQGCLPGGMEEAAGLTVALLKGAVKIIVEGNKQAMKEKRGEQFVDARVQLPNGEWVDGKHEGGRDIKRVKRFAIKRFSLSAFGQGKFLSQKVKYEGDFYEDLFHDLTGKAVYFIDQETQYRGCFFQGKRARHGVLEKYNRETGQFYLYYRGTWKDDQPETGTYYSPHGMEIAHVKDGVMQEQRHVKNDLSRPSRTPLQVKGRFLESNEEKEEGTKGNPRNLFNSRSYPRGRPQLQVIETAPSRQPSKAPRISISPPPAKPKIPFLRTPSPAFDPRIPPEEACPLIAKKLNNPRLELSLDESIELLTTCVRYGQERAKKIEGKEAVIVIGNTGAGKSTMVNYFSGCTMELKSPRELGLTGIKKVVVVRLKDAGGALDEIMPIGHTKESKTFMPQIETDPDEMFTYCDCPGFLDNRGAEINIANAVNVRNAIIKAGKVKVVVLINYYTLLADRGRGLTDMLTICSNLFGHGKNLERYAPSLMLGITQAPLDMDLGDLKEWIVEDTPDVMKILSDRLFLFDPLERPVAGWWNRDECLSRLRDLPSIENPSAIFKTVLTDSDEKKLLGISEKMSEDIQASLKEGNFPLSASRLRHLNNLGVIDHITVERLLNDNKRKIDLHFQHMISAFREHCHFEHFSSAKTLLGELAEACRCFESELEGVINLESLDVYYEESEERYKGRVEKERIAEEKLEQARGQIQELLRLLEEQKQDTLQQMRIQEEKHEEIRREMERGMQAIQRSYKETQEALRREMEERLAKKDEELNLAKSLNQRETQMEIEQEKERLQTEFQRQLQKAEQEKATLLQEQEVQRKQREREMADKLEVYNKRVQALEAQKIQRVEELQTQSLPKIAFGKADWERFFGEVEEEPPLPADMNKILQGPCPFWKGKRVQDTHMLTLIPTTVNGKPLTLNSLKKLIQHPRGGGHATKYRYYYDGVKKEFGAQRVGRACWVLMTKDVLDGSRDKSYDEQRDLVEKHAKRTGLPYEMPRALDAAVSILMHHTKTGERLYTDEPYTFTRCQEKLGDGRRLVVGGFSAGGLIVVCHIHTPSAWGVSGSISRHLVFGGLGSWS